MTSPESVAIAPENFPASPSSGESDARGTSVSVNPDCVELSTQNFPAASADEGENTAHPSGVAAAPPNFSIVTPPSDAGRSCFANKPVAGSNTPTNVACAGANATRPSPRRAAPLNGCVAPNAISPPGPSNEFRERVRFGIEDADERVVRRGREHDAPVVRQRAALELRVAARGHERERVRRGVEHPDGG